jgi:hypothetical protein
MTPGIPEVTCELMLFDGPSQYSSKCKCKCNLHETRFKDGFAPEINLFLSVIDAVFL